MSTSSQIEKVQRAVNRSLHRHWVLYVIEGIVLVILGCLAILVPPLATLAATIVFGWVFLVSGVVGLFTTFWMRHAPGFWWSLLSAVLAIVVGFLLLAFPISGAFSLTIVLIAFFIIEGVASIMFALDHKRELSGRWGWMLASGIVDLILAALIFAGLPSTAAWAIGVLVGINMLFGGSALIAMALHARNAAA
ncbi:MAG TPA: HdeD family acid-resistance protein [Pseudolabrys sp.]|nr:HdeD family acid-resistance protein [Pseudolabrys sp.]